MPTRLSSFVPEVNDLLALEVEELADVLLVHLNSYREDDSSTMQHGKISPGNFLGDLHRSPDYGGQQKEEVRRALMEAWHGFSVRRSWWSQSPPPIGSSSRAGASG
jgi:hypothetical protein